MKKIFTLLAAFIASVSLAFSQGSGVDFNEIQTWVGNGTNEAALAYSYVFDDGTDPVVIVVGYRFNGNGVLALDMLNDICDAGIGFSSQASGNWISGITYDNPCEYPTPLEETSGMFLMGPNGGWGGGIGADVLTDGDYYVIKRFSYDDYELSISSDQCIYVADRSTVETTIRASIAQGGTYTEYGFEVETSDLTVGEQTPMTNRVSSEEPCGRDTVYTLILTVTPSSITGVDYIAAEAVISPVPVVDIVTVAANGEIEEVAVFSAVGQAIFTEVVNARQVSLDLSSIDRGAYLMQIRMADGSVVVRRFIKK